MPCWYYEKKDLRNTPSFQIGVDPDVEARYRREGARFIINTGTKMGLRYDTMATGVVYFHRFYMFHTFKDFPRYVTACCCLFLAGKVEETPKKCKDIIKTARTLLNDSQFTQFGDDPKVNLQEEVMTLERILLQTIKFDLQVDHPYGYLLKYAKCLKGDKQKLQKMVQMAWTFVNDSLCTSLCLQWEPEIIAIALMYLAGKLSKFEVVDWSGRQPKHSRWWDMYVEDMSMELLEDICHQVLDLYSSNPSGIRGDSPMSTSPSQMPGRPPTTQPMPTPATVPQQIQPVPTSVGKSRTCSQPSFPPAALSTRFPCGFSVAKTPPPPQPTPSAIPVQVSKTLPQETPAPPPAKPIQVVEHKPPVVQTVSKPIHPVVQQTIPVVSEPVVTHVPTQPPLPTTPVPLAQPANYNYPPPPPTENYTQFSSPVPPPPTYQPPPNYPPPNYPPLETPSAAQPPPPFDSSAPPPAQYTQPPPQHYPQGYDSQNYTNFQASSQQYFQNQSTYRAPPPPGPQFPDNYNNPPPSQYAPSPAPSTTFPTTPGHPPGYPPQNPPFAPMPSTYAPPRSAPPPHAHHPQPHQPPQHPPPNPGGNIAPVRITGRNNRQSWAM